MTDDRDEDGHSHLSVGVILPDDSKVFPLSKSLLRDVVQEKVTLERDTGWDNDHKKQKKVTKNGMK